MKIIKYVSLTYMNTRPSVTKNKSPMTPIAQVPLSEAQRATWCTVEELLCWRTSNENSSKCAVSLPEIKFAALKYSFEGFK